ncbi:MAG: ATP-grasp domain-containing protein [Anaerolineae bacterium]
MRLLEWEAKELLTEAGIMVPRGKVVSSPQEAARFAAELGQPVVLKTQIPLGGRMKAGGVHFVSDRRQVAVKAERLLEKKVSGFLVEKLLVEEQIEQGDELFLAVTYDATSKRALILASTEGGIAVEEAAEVVRRYPLSLCKAFPTYQAREVASQLSTGGSLRKLTTVVTNLVGLFTRYDALLVEINPLFLTKGGDYVAVDAHIELDDEALFRHRDLVEQLALAGRGERPRTPFEQQAVEIDTADHRGVAGRVVEFDGDLGLLIGGGGASLAIFDAVLDAGIKPANYCEMGGNPSVWKVKELTKLILAQPQVERIAVIMNVVSNTRVDLVARGVIKGILELGLDPAGRIAAFRIPGSWEEEGFAILDHYGVPHFGRETAIDEVVKGITD